MMEKKKLWLFLTLCFSISFLSAGLFYALGGKYASIVGTLFAAGYMFIPLISVVITQLITGERPFSGCGVTFRMKWVWLVAGLLGMQAFALLVIPVSALIPGVSMALDNPAIVASSEAFSAQGVNMGPWGVLAASLISGLVAACSINALYAFGEEVAWRGFLSRILDGLGFWKRSMVVGAIWGFWHAPLILMGHNYPHYPVIGVFMMIAFCVLYAPLIQYIRDRSGSVIAAAVMHGSLNAVAGLSILYLAGYKELLCGCCGVAGFAVLLILDLVLFFCTRRKN